MRDPAAPALERRTLDELVIDDEDSFGHVALYADLKEILRREAYPFRVLPPTSEGRWDRALLLNLTFWASGEGGDVLVDDHIAADVVAHVAWHHLASRALSGGGTQGLGARPTAAALFLGEAIASAFDVYLIGRLLGHSPRSAFLRTQVPAMAATSAAAGLSAAGFEQLLQRIADDPERSFEELRQLLCDATGALMGCAGASEALAVLTRFQGHAFASLLHRHELSNWVLYARAYAAPASDPDETVRALDRLLRSEEDSLAWLAAEWVSPARSPSVKAPTDSRSTFPDGDGLADLRRQAPPERGNARPRPRARR
jgi:hypothetical protein